MNNIITRIVLFITMFSLMTVLGNLIGLTLLPLMAGITFFGRKKDSSNPLPNAYNGVKGDNLTKTAYIKEQTDLIDRNKVYDKVVDEATQKAEQQWNDDNPHFDNIQRHVRDKNYRMLASAYIRADLTFADAFKNTFIAIIRDIGVDIVGNNQYSVDMTVGEFINHVITLHDFDDYSYRSSEMLNAILDIRNDYGVMFNNKSPSTELPSEKEGEERTSFGGNTPEPVNEEPTRKRDLAGRFKGLHDHVSPIDNSKKSDDNDDDDDYCDDYCDDCDDYF